MLVRHNVGHAVMTTLHQSREGYKLLEVDAVSGKLPEVNELLGLVYPDLQAVRNCLVVAMKDLGDTLDRVSLSLAAYYAWQDIAVRAGQKANSLGVSVEEIPDELAKALPDGHLLIWVDVPMVGRVELSIPPHDWEWTNKKRPN